MLGLPEKTATRVDRRTDSAQTRGRGRTSFSGFSVDRQRKTSAPPSSSELLPPALPRQKTIAIDRRETAVTAPSLDLPKVLVPAKQGESARQIGLPSTGSNTKTSAHKFK